MTVRVLVVDDHLPVRVGFSMIINAADGVEVVGEAGDGEQALRLAQKLTPDVVLMDIRMPRLDGIATTRRMCVLGVTNVLLTTAFDADEYLFAALRAGAAGFLLKDTDADSLIRALRSVADGGGVLSPSVTRRLITDYAARMSPPETREQQAKVLEPLTAREREVLACVGRGLSNRQIATELRLAENTAKTHVSRVLAKLGLSSRVQAAILAQELDLA
ncbi:response regulator [Actinomadura algeriensis]|uniref:DNA-binding NarL/FixJ family response regulator n=1 Tax=Actinomadura algeriensis TaxID=1679523 RepID=A0ABR9JIR3_9ACTN|nr:response regulator transcription factor [Actinomadura algeriensis]MBE1530413.1 DNA-binding NarL/FixJ family response regulator [Actinomadura algeriensis]